MKKRILFIAQHRPNRSPSQRFRFEQYIEFLEGNGYECSFSYLINAADDKVFYSKGRLLQKLMILIKSYRKRLKDLRMAKNTDIVFVQREGFMTGTTFFERAVTKVSTKLVFDFDDSVWLQNVSEANRYLNFLKNPSKTSEIIKISDHAIAGNEYLADYAKQFNTNVSIIPTTIDTGNYQRIQKESSEPIVIGWSGSITTIQHFEFALPFLTKLKERHGDKIKIKVIGDGNYEHKKLGVQGIAWNEADEIKELSEFDIGIMPLPDDEWAKGKCGLKGLQYMALEIPTIMSPVGVNSEIIVHGKNGFLAGTEEEWQDCVEKLINDRDSRYRIGLEGRKTVEDKYSVKANRQAYLDLFDSLTQ